MKALLVAALLAGTPDAGTDTPWRLEPAGTVLQVDAVVTTPEAAQAVDVALRASQKDADAYRAVVLVVTPIAVLATVATVILSAALVTKK